MQEKIINYVERNDLIGLKNYLLELNDADISECLDDLPEEDAAVVFRLLDKDKAANVFSRMESDTQEKLVNILSDQEVGEIVNKLFIDDAVDLVSEMPANLVTRILQNTDSSKRSYINAILQYPEDSAGSLMTIEYEDVYMDMTVQDAFDRIRKTGMGKETVYIVYVLDNERHLVGLVSVRKLLLSDPEAKISDIMERKVVTINTHLDKEDVARMFDKYDYIAMPVVDSENRMVGIITIDDALDVMSEENEEDFEIMAAMSPSEDSYFKTSVWDHTKHRIVWLLVLMLSATITGTILTHYENAFASVPILVSFIPMIMDTGGNCGSQSSTMIIRGLATGEIKLRDVLKVWFKEARIALLVGVILAVVNGVRIMLMYDNPLLAMVTGVTLVFTVILAKSLGCLLPMAAKKLKLDPAIMASPLITTVVDTCSMLIYFNVAVALMNI